MSPCRTGLKGGMMIGLFVMAVGALLFIPAAITRTYFFFLSGLFIMGSGLALLQTAANPYITILGPIESVAQRISIMGMGKTLVINYDMQLPRPYSNRWLLEGTLGVYDEEKSSLYLEGRSPEYHNCEPWPPYEEKYLHKWWNADFSAGSHGGTDTVMLIQFLDAVRAKGPTPIDVYDSAVMSAIVELSGLSIEKNAPVPFPDFTKGKWESNRNFFAPDQSL